MSSKYGFGGSPAIPWSTRAKKTSEVTAGPGTPGVSTPLLGRGKVPVGQKYAIGGASPAMPWSNFVKMEPAHQARPPPSGAGRVVASKRAPALVLDELAGPDEDVAESQRIGQISLNMALSYLLELLPWIISLLFVARLGNRLQLAAATEAVMFHEVSAFFLGNAIAMGLDALIGQSASADQVSSLLPRACGFGLVALVPATLANVYSESILTLLQQPADLIPLAAVYCRYLIIGLPAVWLYDLYSRALHSHSLVNTSAYVMLPMNLLNLLLHYYLIEHLNWGFTGAAIARSLASWSLPVLLWTYSKIQGVSLELDCSSSSSLFSDWGSLVQGSLPGTALSFAQWIPLELGVFVAGTLVNSHVNIISMAQLFYTTTLLYLVYLGIADAVAGRVSHHISNNQAPAARSASITGLVAGISFGVLAAILVFSGCIPMLSNDLEVTELTRRLLLPLALCQFFDGVATVGFGVLRGVSRQSLAAVESLLGLVVVGFPVGLYLAIKQGWQLSGFIWGVTIGSFLACLLSVGYVHDLDWRNEAKLADERLAMDEEKESHFTEAPADPKKQSSRVPAKSHAIVDT